MSQKGHLDALRHCPYPLKQSRIFRYVDKCFFRCILCSLKYSLSKVVILHLSVMVGGAYKRRLSKFCSHRSYYDGAYSTMLNESADGGVAHAAFSLLRLLLQFFFSSSVVFLLVINYELPKQVMRGRLKEKWLFSRLFWFLCLLNHVWEGEVSNRWNEPPYHLLRHQRVPTLRAQVATLLLL